MSSDIERASSSTARLADPMFELLPPELAGLIPVARKACLMPSVIKEGTSDDGLVSAISFRRLDDMPEMYASEYGPWGFCRRCRVISRVITGIHVDGKCECHGSDPIITAGSSSLSFNNGGGT